MDKTKTEKNRTAITSSILKYKSRFSDDALHNTKLDMQGGVFSEKLTERFTKKEKSAANLVLELEFMDRFKSEPAQKEKIKEYYDKNDVSKAEAFIILDFLIRSNLEKDSKSEALQKCRKEDFEIKPQECQDKLDEMITLMEVVYMQELSQRMLTEAQIIDDSDNIYDVANAITDKTSDERAQIRNITGRIVNTPKVQPSQIARAHSQLFRLNARINGIAMDDSNPEVDKKTEQRISNIRQTVHNGLELPITRGINKAKDDIQEKRMAGVPQ